MPTASLSADGRMNSAEFHILRRNEDLYASKREPCSFSCGHYTKNSASRVEQSAPRRVRPLGLRLPSKRTSPFFGGYPSSNRTCRFPAYSSPCGFTREVHLRCRLFVCLARLAHIGHAPTCAPFGSPSARFPPKGVRLSAVHLCTAHRPNCMLTSLQCRPLSFC